MNLEYAYVIHEIRVFWQEKLIRASLKSISFHFKKLSPIFRKRMNLVSKAQNWFSQITVSDRWKISLPIFIILIFLRPEITEATVYRTSFIVFSKIDQICSFSSVFSMVKQKCKFESGGKSKNKIFFTVIFFRFFLHIDITEANRKSTKCTSTTHLTNQGW